MKRADWLPFALLFASSACGGSPPAQPTTPAVSSAPIASATPSSSASAATAPPPPAKDVACDAIATARKDENTRLKAIADSQDPMSRIQGMNEDVVNGFFRCTKTKSGGAWGLGLSDLKVDQTTHGVSAELVAIHADAKGQIAKTPLAGTARTKDRAFQSNDLDHVAIDTQMVYDFDADGEDELVAIGHDQTKEGSRESLAYIVQAKNGAAQIYPPAKDLPIFRVEDVDRDGRPDFISYGPYRTFAPGRCNGAPALFNGPPMLIHSLPDGTFSMVDDKAVAFAKQQCDKPGFTVARDDQKRVDDEQTFVNIACARLWGMSAADAAAAVARSCNAIRGEASCKESTLTACVYPAEMTQWARAKPPLSIK
ncbi:MAG TPA: hypothetical protein VGH28_28020 [Polyangiaceae bacterium]|jgi:hypothetical protein